MLVLLMTPQRHTSAMVTQFFFGEVGDAAGGMDVWLMAAAFSWW
jgi:hypothetical protein